MGNFSDLNVSFSHSYEKNNPLALRFPPLPPVKGSNSETTSRVAEAAFSSGRYSFCPNDSKSFVKLSNMNSINSAFTSTGK